MPITAQQSKYLMMTFKLPTNIKYQRYLGNEDSLLRIPGQIIQTGTVVAGQRLWSSLEFVVGVIVPGSRQD